MRYLTVLIVVGVWLACVDEKSLRRLVSASSIPQTFLKMYHKCCVPECNSLRQDVKMHQFPSNEQLKTQWLKCLALEDVDDVKNMFVCHKHFEARFVNPGTNRLKIGAYPTLVTQLEISSGIPISASMQTDDISSCSDHNYSKKRHIDHSYAQMEHTAKKLHRMEASEANILLGSAQNAACLELGTPDIEMLKVPVEMSEIDKQGASSSTSVQMTSGPVYKVRQQNVKKKRFLRNVNSLTPKCKSLYKEFRKVRRQNNYQVRAKRALVFSKQKSFEEMTEKMNPLVKKVLWMQVKLCMKNKKARRFTTEEKLIALSIYKQGPKSYKFLQKIFILPSKTTLKKMISGLDINTGINPQIFGLLKNEVDNWDPKKKFCTIMFDEMALETTITYAAANDEIMGFVDLNGKLKQFADHALVFMLRGAVYKWQQPIAFYFCEGATSGPQLKGILKEIVAAVTNTGLKPIALACDQGSSFQSALNSLLEDTKADQLRAEESVDGTINLSGNTLSVFYDPPHLIKGIRNNMLTKNMIFEGKTVKWQDIVDVYKVDNEHGQSRILNKLTDQHVIPEKIKKMKVRNCVKVLSKSVASALSYTSGFPLLPDGKPVSCTMKNTSEAISFFDDLFDSVNGAGTLHKKCKGKKTLRKAVTAKSVHHRFWSNAKKILKKVRYVTKQNQHKSVPSVKNWVTTIESFQRVWRMLKTKRINILRPRYFNTDPIENFFGQVRAYNYRNNDPSPYAFLNTFKSLLITRIINFHSENFNCEDDASKDLLNIQSLFLKNKNTAPISEVEQVPDCNEIDDNFLFDHENIQMQARRERLNIHSRAYTVGWVTRKIFTKINCEACKKNFLTENESSTHAFIKEKEYKSIRMKKLCYPTENAVTSFGNIIKTTNEYLETNGHAKLISKKIKEAIISKYSFGYIDCAMHKEVILHWFLDISIKLFVFNWCNIINKILKGTDIIRLSRTILPPMQLKALNKFKKKLKNKKFNK